MLSAEIGPSSSLSVPSDITSVADIDVEPLLINVGPLGSWSGSSSWLSSSLGGPRISLGGLLTGIGPDVLSSGLVHPHLPLLQLLGHLLGPSIGILQLQFQRFFNLEVVSLQLYLLPEVGELQLLPFVLRPQQL